MDSHEHHEEHDNHVHRESWLERWWFLLVILFGILCILALDGWHPIPSV